MFTVSKTNQSTVAVKILKQQSPSKKTLESFAKEIWMHSQIRHPHVLQFFGGCTVVPKLCLVSEYMFCSLQHALDHDPGAFHPQSEVEIATSIALGLNHLHILNIMHRDLKASNVLLDKNYCNPKIADFGLARIRQEAESGSSACQGGTLREKEVRHDSKEWEAVLHRVESRPVRGRARVPE